MEGMELETLRKALLRAGVTVEGRAERRSTLTKVDFFMNWAFPAGRTAPEKRTALLKKAGAAGAPVTNGLLQALSVLYTRKSCFSFARNWKTIRRVEHGTDKGCAAGRIIPRPGKWYRGRMWMGFLRNLWWLWMKLNGKNRSWKTTSGAWNRRLHAAKEETEHLKQHLTETLQAPSHQELVCAELEKERETS